jgi:hypothetical protein
MSSAPKTTASDDIPHQNSAKTHMKTTAPVEPSPMRPPAQRLSDVHGPSIAAAGRCENPSAEAESAIDFKSFARLFERIADAPILPGDVCR